MKKIFDEFMRLTNVILAFVGLFLVVLGAVFFYRENLTAGASAIAAGAFLVIMGTIDKYSIIKAFGIEATLKQINKDAEQANLAMELIRELTSKMYKSHIEGAALTWGAGQKWLDKLEEEVTNNISKLKEIGVPSEDIMSVRDCWLQPQMLYIMNKIREDAANSIGSKSDDIRNWATTFLKMQPLKIGSASSLNEQMLSIISLMPDETMRNEKKDFQMRISKWVEEFKKSEKAYGYANKEMWIEELKSSWRI